ncbi:alpha/beta fold hydrolase [Dongia sp.]|uniref:alpha/beta fold hydrolase n=1 Tax=Dongia sp. TaxID=1977262 RepID=UPI0035AFFDBD
MMGGGDRILGDGTRFAVTGSGRPLILVHGVGMDLSMWQPLAVHLARHRQVIRYDMIGHGASPKPPGPYRLADFVAQLQRLADTLNLSRFDLLGFSMGGLVAQGFAVTHAARLDRLILLNTVYRRSQAERDAVFKRVSDVLDGGFPASVDTAIDRWFTPGFRIRHPETVDAVRRHMLSNDLGAYAAAYRVFAAGDAELADTAARIKTATLVMTGSDDQRSTAAMAAALVADLPLGQLAILPGQRHLTPIECPGELAARILEFIAVPAVAQGEVGHG